ncbi:MAG: c-type cytochrome [Thiobacillus sp.]
MADPHANMTQSTPQEIIISVIAGLLAPLLAIFLVVQLIRGIQEKQVDVDTSEAANKTVVARIKPFATLVALDANAPRVEQSGEQVFTTVCSACHTPGALGAPKLNSKGDWGPRLGQGFDTLIKHAIEGIRAMPPRGGSPDLSDIEVARAVAYMANSAGASFKEPAAEAAPAATAAAGAASATTAGADAAPDAAASDKAVASPVEKTAPAAAPIVVTAKPNAAPASSSTSQPAAASAPAKATTTQAAPAAVATAKPVAPPSTAVKAAADMSGKGEATYKQSCAVCHAAGVAGAPKLTDKVAWAPRIASGKEALYASGLKGKGEMPAKGGNPSLSDADVKAAVDYMVSQAK